MPSSGLRVVADALSPMRRAGYLGHDSYSTLPCHVPSSRRPFLLYSFSSSVCHHHSTLLPPLFPLFLVVGRGGYAHGHSAPGHGGRRVGAVGRRRVVGRVWRSWGNTGSQPGERLGRPVSAVVFGRCAGFESVRWSVGLFLTLVLLRVCLSHCVCFALVWWSGLLLVAECICMRRSVASLWVFRGCGGGGCGTTPGLVRRGFRMRRTRCGEHGEDNVGVACALAVVHRAVCRCAGASFGTMRTLGQCSVSDIVWCDGSDDIIPWCLLLLLSRCLFPLHFGLQGPHDRDRVQPGLHCDCVPPAHWQPPVRVILAAM